MHEPNRPQDDDRRFLTRVVLRNYKSIAVQTSLLPKSRSW